MFCNKLLKVGRRYESENKDMDRNDGSKKEKKKIKKEKRGCKI